MDLLEELEDSKKEINAIMNCINDFESEEEQEKSLHPFLYQDEEFPANFQDTNEFKFRDIFYNFLLYF